MSEVQLHLGDCAKVMAEMPEGCIDLTVTSPPYDNLRTYKGYTFDFETIARQLYRVTKAGGVVVWVVGDATINGSETGTSFRQALYFMECGFNLHDTMIYQTDKPPMNDRRYQAEFEFMLIFTKDKPSTFNPIMVKSKQQNRIQRGYYRNTDGTLRDRFSVAVTHEFKKKGAIWYFASGGIDIGHPAPFPEALARDHILSWSNPGDTVLDPMCGSGTTGKMAVLYQRNFIGIEIASEYLEIARRRIERAQMQLPLFGALPPSSPPDTLHHRKIS